ncbi:DNA replication protein DnaC [Pelomonas aquatica]|uniref:DNA replication protein DnaC n=1 Tax=Pelomonas aquatica TaxID=431058 RepID=A0ABU1ZCB2_9BURK|nr:IS21-like element helper ATPase IstB [Pelomonas aquatica]MDR7298257.1 DNA replication protein DnaC [Pelomonas aquatica]
MLNNATIAQLRALKLQGFADALQQQHDQADCLGLSFDERLALLVEREVYARGDRKRTRLLQRVQLKYPSATLEDASFEGVRGIDRSALMGPALSTWFERGETICFAGATGLGKTWLACALAQDACRQGHSALYLRVPRLGEELRVLHGAGSYRRLLQQLAKIDVLVLDDWGTGPLDAATQGDLLEIIDDRSAQRATIITHQLPIEHWHAWLGDPTVADAILDRLMQHCRRFSLEGASRRTGHATRPGGKARNTAQEGES